MDTSKRNEKVDLLRGFAAICMILGHSFIVHPVDISNVPWCLTIKHIIYTFHMELFFILSGWVCRYRTYGGFIKRKTQRLLLPYLIFGTGSLLAHAIGGSAVNGSISFSDGIIKLLFHGGGYWFIYVLFLVFAIFPVFNHFCSSLTAKALAIIAGLFLNECFDFPVIFCIDTVIHYYPYFILGAILGKCDLKQLDQKTRHHWAGLSLLCLLFYRGIDFLLQNSLLSWLDYTLTFIRATAFCTMLYALCFVPIPTFIKHFVLDASRFSLQLYLFNGYFLTALRILVCSILHIESPVIIVLAIWLGNIIITLFVCKVVLPRSRLLRLMCGIPDTMFPQKSSIQLPH